MKTFLTKLTSRKFLMAVAAVVTLLANHQYPAAAGVAGAYIAAEAHLDKHSIVADAMTAIETANATDEEAAPEKEPAIGFSAPAAPEADEPAAIPSYHGEKIIGFAGPVR